MNINSSIYNVTIIQRKEKTARLYEQGAHSALSSAEIKERIEQYRQRQRILE